MKKLAIVFVTALALSGCIIDDVCMTEQRAHAFYVSFVAPLRPADRVAREAAFYAKAQSYCAIGNLVAAQQASAQAQAARGQ